MFSRECLLYGLKKCRGELLGGADSSEELAESGELEKKLESALGAGDRSGPRREDRRGRLAVAKDKPPANPPDPNQAGKTHKPAGSARD